MVPVWLRMWKYFEKHKSVDSISQLMRDLELSPNSCYDNVSFLDELGLITIHSTGKGKVITANQKFYSTYSNFKELYNTYNKKGDGF